MSHLFGWVGARNLDHLGVVAITAFVVLCLISGAVIVWEICQAADQVEDR